MTDALKPCPFCGGRGELWAAMGETWIACTECGAIGNMTPRQETTIAAWNRRAPQPSPATDALADELRERIARIIEPHGHELLDRWLENAERDGRARNDVLVRWFGAGTMGKAEAILSALREREHQEEQS